MNSTIVESAQMPACDSKINATDFNVRHLLGLDDSVTHIFFRNRGVGDLSFSYAAGLGLTQSDDIQRAISRYVADDGAYLRCSNFQSYNNRGWLKHVFSLNAAFLVAWPGSEERRWLRAIAPEYCSKWPNQGWQ